MQTPTPNLASLLQDLPSYLVLQGASSDSAHSPHPPASRASPPTASPPLSLLSLQSTSPGVLGHQAEALPPGCRAPPQGLALERLGLSPQCSLAATGATSSPCHSLTKTLRFLIHQPWDFS